MTAVIPDKDYLEVVEQNVVKIVWQDPNAPPRPNAIAVAIGEYGTLIEKVWNEHKMFNTQRKEATKEQEDSKDQKIIQEATKTAAKAKKELKRLTDMIRVAVETVTEFASDSILENMGTYQRLTIILLNYVRYCYTNKDYNGRAPKSVLRLISKFTTLSTHFLGHLKLEQLRTKYLKELDVESRGFFRNIFNNAKQRDKQQPPSETQAQPATDIQGTKKTTTAPDTNATPPVSAKSQPVKTDVTQKSVAPDAKKMQPIKYAGLESARKVSNGTAAKRLRDDDSDTRSSKKVAVEGVLGGPAATKQSSTLTTVPAASIPTTSATSQTGLAAASQSRPKPSASILPGKSRSTAKPAGRKVDLQKIEPQKSVFGSLLEDIAKPKETPKPHRETQGPPETAEEKERRLRKESRRGRRVTWAPEDELVVYHVFEHDPDEDEGRASSQLRDARDNRSEGQMLKSVMQGKKGKEECEESDDDEDDEIREILLKDLGAPKESQRVFPSNLERRGGNRQAETDEQKYMSDYESRELMSIYTTAAEIPSSPREPPQKALAEPPARPSACPAPNGPKAHETYQRAIESRQFNYRVATQQAISRLPRPSKTPQTHLKAQSEPRMMTQEERDAEVLALLGSKKVTEWIDPDPYNAARPKTERRHNYNDPEVQESADAIEAVVEELKGKPFPPTEPPKWLQDDPARVKEWWTGHNANAAKAPISRTEVAAVAYPTHSITQQALQPQQDASINSIASLLQQVQAIQSNQTLQANAPSQQQTAVQPQTSGPPDISVILRALNPTTQPTQSHAQTQAQHPADANTAAWMAYYAQLQSAQNPQGQAAYQQQQQPTSASDYNAEANAAQWAAYYKQYQDQVQQSQSQNQGQGQAENQASYGQEHQQYDSDHQNSRRERDRRNNNGSAGRPHGGNRGGDRDSRGINRSLIGTKPCTFWAKNQCTKGDKCTFRHDTADLVNANY